VTKHLPSVALKVRQQYFSTLNCFELFLLKSKSTYSKKCFSKNQLSFHCFSNTSYVTFPLILFQKLKKHRYIMLVKETFVLRVAFSHLIEFEEMLGTGF
jgi:hypothetical protein